MRQLEQPRLLRAGEHVDLEKYTVWTTEDGTFVVPLRTALVMLREKNSQLREKLKNAEAPLREKLGGNEAYILELKEEIEKLQKKNSQLKEENKALRSGIRREEAIIQLKERARRALETAVRCKKELAIEMARRIAAEKKLEERS